MTDNQFNQLFDLITKSVTVTQEVQRDVSVLKADVSELKKDVSELKKDVSELKQGQIRIEEDVSELKAGQNRIERQLRLNNVAINEMAGEQFEIKGRISELEKATY